MARRHPGAVTVSACVGRYGWNAADVAGRVPGNEVRELVDACCDAVVAALARSRRPS
ncbi:hypothetical protein [Blastococcus sp. TF02A-26]|uniref:hypothetical protein n=1 Tax=Blastococcus sp. TF02A-26 TaxID=2250577 RepID=UPI0013148414|nr:hypothetical protein [Blastococcus sp. TF02A-26]